MTAPLEALVARVHGSLADTSDRESAAGLLNGSCGLALFYAYHFQWSQDERDVDRMNAVLQNAVGAIAANRLGTSHCSGIAGIAWCLQHLLAQGFVDDEIRDVFAQLDPILAAEMDRALAASEHDFLHQGLGILLYFLEKLPDPAAHAQLERAVARLEATAVHDSELVRWQDHFTREASGDPVDRGPRFNLGLAHGTPAIMSILAKISSRGIARERIEPLLRGTVKWLHASADASTQLGRYPTMVDANQRPFRTEPTRLGWCYGDLGVAIALSHAGTALGDSQILGDARSILAHSLDRTPEHGMVADAGLCHGSVGISHIYRRAHQLTGDAALQPGVDRWLDYTVELACTEAGLLAKQVGRYVACDDLLQGLTGIGLGLLAAVDRETSPDWDRCMLFS